MIPSPKSAKFDMVNRIKHNESQRLYRKRNAEELKIKTKEWKNANAQKLKDYRDIERFGGLRLIALKRDNYSCVNCGMTNDQHKKRWNREITVDHIDGNGRYSKTPNNSISNLQTLCLVCHGSKDNAVRRLKPEQVLAIRHMLGLVTYLQIAKAFNVDRSTIRGIKSGKSWKHVQIGSEK